MDEKIEKEKSKKTKRKWKFINKRQKKRLGKTSQLSFVIA